MNQGTKLKWVIVVTAFCLLHLLFFTRVFYSGGPDVAGYYQYAVKMDQGQVAYRDFSVEYPPGALAVFYLPGLVSDNLQEYETAFTFEMLLFDLIGLLLVLGIGRKAGISPWSCLIGYTLAMVAIGSIMVQRFDMVPAVITLGAVYAFSRGNYKIAWAILAIGTMIKLSPGLLAPLFLIYQWRRGGLRSVIPSVAAFAAVTLLIAVPLLALDRHGFISSFTIQGQRALQLESTYSSLLLLGNSLGIVSAYPIQGSISYDIASSLAGPLARYSFVFMGVGLLAVYGLYYRNCRKLARSHARFTPESTALADLLNYSFAAIVLLLVTSKVFSPQFMVWLYPLFPLVSGRFRSTLWVIFLTASCLTWYIYPLHYYELIDIQQLAADALILRNTLLIFAAVLLLGEKATTAEKNTTDAPLELRPASG
ncbi:MAG: DUF2029 domain-containing protein [Dehalococcoidia bacterium]|nr:MAG: DUF2029 domain-containing protein [Dehalococcoidia bacterium]